VVVYLPPTVIRPGARKSALRPARRCPIGISNHLEGR